MSSAVAKFACAACGKTYAWKEQFAGKKLKCSCGQLMQAPMELPAPQPPPEQDLFELAPEPEPPRPRMPQAPPAGGPPCPACGEKLPTLDAILCIHCGHNLKTGKKIKTKVGKPAKGGHSGGGGAATAVAGYVADPSRHAENEPAPRLRLDEAKQHIIPLALIVFGLAAIVAVVMLEEKSIDLSSVLVAVGILTAVQIVLTLAGIFATAKIMGISFGAFGPAILKICAVCLLPGAVASLIEWAVPSGGAAVSWVVSLLLYGGLFMFLFDIDLGETLVCTAVIWLIGNWGQMVILLVWAMIVSN